LLALRDYALWNAVRFSMDARHVVRLPEGLEIILGKKENYGSVVYTHFLSDYAELLFLAHCLRSGDLFADVGANVGLYSVWVAGSTGARVVAPNSAASTTWSTRKTMTAPILRSLPRRSTRPWASELRLR
jgi:hypothetical protein